jgi:hypothetical protein
MRMSYRLFICCLVMSLLGGCNGNVLESKSLELAQFSRVEKGGNKWSVELSDGSGPMWEVSFGKWGTKMSDYVGSKYPDNCAIQLKIKNPNQYNLIVVSLKGKRTTIAKGEEYILFEGEFTSLSYESSVTKVFPSYYMSDSFGTFSFDVVLVSTCEIELDKVATINAYRIDSM